MKKLTSAHTRKPTVATRPNRLGSVPEVPPKKKIAETSESRKNVMAQLIMT